VKTPNLIFGLNSVKFDSSGGVWYLYC